MAIKSKKWKSIISFGAFFMAINLALVNGIPLVQELAWSVRNGVPFEGLERDYRNTTAFQNQMEEYLADFLAMAVGEAPGTFGGRYYSTSYDSAAVTVEDDELTYVSEGTAEGGWAEVTFWDRLFGSSDTSVSMAEETDDASYAADRTEKLTKAQKKAAADEFHESIYKDQNLLYRISYDGEVLYTNMAAGKWKTWGDTLPDGYNFVMQYQGSHVKIAKDGEDIDVYGDGYYDGGDDWFVPGYQNFTVDDTLNKAEIVIFAAGEPKNYTSIRYGSGTSIRTSTLYRLYQNTMHNYTQTVRNIAGLFTGAVLFLLYLCLRRGKRDADVWLGRVTGKIWFEAKLLLALAVLAAAVAYAVNDILWNYGYWGQTQNLLMLLSFWTIYLAFNDIRRNPHTFRNGLISRFAGIAETKSLKLSFSKRMVQRFAVVLAAGLFGGVGMIVFAAVCRENRLFFSDVTAYVLAALCSVAVFLGASGWYLVRIKRQAGDLDLLVTAIDAVHDGGGDGMRQEIRMPKDPGLADAFAKLGDIQSGMEAAVEERTKSERMKVELVANVSHDIKTPLTSIISYIQFLKQEEGLPEHVKDYIRILDEKSERLKNMVQDVFSVSKAVSGQLPVEPELLDFGKLLRQTLADMEEEIAESSVTIRTEIPEAPVLILADGKRMYRVFQNLIQNALKYSLEGSRVYLSLRENGVLATAVIKNISRQELRGDRDFTERFVRGDASRTDGGSGLGLSIAKSFTEACGGMFRLETNADLFVVTVEFEEKTEKI